MSPTLKDLRAFDPSSTCGHDGCVLEDRRNFEEESRPVSLADLVEVLKAEGAKEVDVDWGDSPYAPNVHLDNPGRYLILPLGDTP